MNNVSLPIKTILDKLEEFAPLALKEDFDNVGLLVGDNKWPVTGVLITLDITEEVLDEAIATKSNLIIAHHPITLSGLKRLTGKNAAERIFIKAIKNDIAIYASHTNIDSISQGVSGRMCDKLGLINTRILAPKKEALLKLATYVPLVDAPNVRQALFNAGAGQIGNYSSCSFNIHGEGTFMANNKATPYIGAHNALHTENETRIETILPRYLKHKVIQALTKAHPYEEVAYDLFPLENEWLTTGLGMIGELPQAMDERTLLTKIKSTFNCECIRHTELLNKPIKKIALCGGAGSFLLENAKNAGAQLFITGDFKYHQFFDAEKQLIIADIGHFESEQYTKEVFFEILTKNFSNFAVRLSQINTNSVKYF